MKRIIPFLGSQPKQLVAQDDTPKDDLAMLLSLKYQEGYAAALNDFINEMKKCRNNYVLVGVAPAVRVMQMRVVKMKQEEQSRI